MTEQLGASLDWESSKEGSALSLMPSELHIWWLPLTISAEHAQFTLGHLNERQREKYHRRATSDLQHAYLAGRYHLLTLLAAYANCKPDKIKLSYNRLNKPSLNINNTDEVNQQIHFNFTDTNIGKQSHGLFAFCRQHPVGVDLEACDRKSAFKKIAQRRFTQTELEYVTNENGLIDSKRCLAVWTRKEAYGKAIGQGINFQMNERNLVSDNFKQPFKYNFNDSKDDWRLIQIQPEQRFIACVVHQSHQNLLIKAFNRPYHIA